MYFVDRDLLEQRLLYFENLMDVFTTKSHWEGEWDKLALERIVHMTIESLIDVGNQMIDGFIMRDPGSYEDVIDILMDEGVLSKEEGAAIKRIIVWRKALLQEYHLVQIEEMVNAFKGEVETLVHFPKKIRHYLNSELGPVSAFLPSKE